MHSTTKQPRRIPRLIFVGATSNERMRITVSAASFSVPVRRHLKTGRRVRLGVGCDFESQPTAGEATLSRGGELIVHSRARVAFRMGAPHKSYGHSDPAEGRRIARGQDAELNEGASPAARDQHDILGRACGAHSCYAAGPCQPVRVGRGELPFSWVMFFQPSSPRCETRTSMRAAPWTTRARPICL